MSTVPIVVGLLSLLAPALAGTEVAADTQSHSGLLTTAIDDTEPPLDSLSALLPDDADQLPEPDVLLTCGFGPPFTTSDLRSLTPATSLDPDLYSELNAILDEAAGLFPTTDWQLLDHSPPSIDLIHIDGDRAAFLSVNADENGLRLVHGDGLAPCDLHILLPPAVNPVDWILDPAHPLTAESTTVHLLLREVGCASGQPIGDRLVGPVVEETATTVMVLIAIEPPSGFQRCPSNPWTPVTLGLDSPIGEREVRDALTLPVTLADLTRD